MNSEKYIKEKINLTTLTPIFIGDDQSADLSPITDFVVEQDKLRIIDQNKIEDILSEDPQLIDEYVEQVKSGIFKLKPFIENRLNSTVEELTKKTLTIQHFPGQGEIKSFINSLGNVFIPGSTIKGAIRTTVIYQYLSQIEKGQKIIERIFIEVEKKQIQIEKLLKIKKERRLNKNGNDELRRLQYWKNNERDFRKLFNELYLFKSNDFGHDFRHLQISDTQFFELKDIKIIQLFREYLTQDKTKTQPWAQVLKEKTTTKFNFKIEKDFKDPFLQNINSNTYKEIFRMVNKFSLDVLDFEIDRFNEFINSAAQDKEKIQKKLTGIISYYKELIDKIKFSRDNCAVIRIGGGKTYFDNSIGLALYIADKDKFKQFRKLLGFWKHRSGAKNFVEGDSPITRTFYHNKGNDIYLPIGWSVLYFEKDKKDIIKLFDLENITEQKIQTEIETNKSDNNEDSELDFSKLSNLGRVIQKKKD